jgi:hypothetical protein
MTDAKNLKYTCSQGKSRFHLFPFSAHSNLDGSMSEWHNSAPTWHTLVLSAILPQHPSALLCFHGAGPVVTQGTGKLHVLGGRASRRWGQHYSQCGVSPWWCSVVTVLATGPKGCGFKPGQGDGFLMTIKIRRTPSSRMGSKVGRSHVVRFYST